MQFAVAQVKLVPLGRRKAAEQRMPLPGTFALKSRDPRSQPHARLVEVGLIEYELHPSGAWQSDATRQSKVERERAREITPQDPRGQRKLKRRGRAVDR